VPALEDIVQQLRWQDIVDVLVLTAVLFRAIVWLRGTVALQVLAGMLVLVAAAFAAEEIGLLLTAYLLRAAGAVATLVVVVVFRNEIRRALSRVNPLHLWRGRNARAEAGAPVGAAEILARAAFELARRRTGALLVVRNLDPLEEHLTGGVPLDAQPSVELIESIFHTSSPIHDGAAVVEAGRLARAGCFLPLSTSSSLPDGFGSRHRAAAGLSEVCDAFVAVVSEERGRVSLFQSGAVIPIEHESNLAARLAGTGAAGRHGRNTAGMRARARARLADAATFAGVLALVLGAWYVVVGEPGTVVTHTVSVELRNVPQSLEVDPPSPGRAAVHLRGPRTRLESVDGADVAAWVDLTGADPGRRRYRLEASAPAGVHVEEIVPAAVTVRLRTRR
jgi:uncharacterized protein (TIGR00159 family)